MALRPSSPQSRSDQLARRGQAEQEVLLREVDDALREDKLLTAARRYGILIALALLAALVALGAYLWWDARRDDRANAAGEKFVVALDRIEAGQVAGGSAALAPLAAEGTPGYQAASRLLQAGLAVEQGQPAQAEKLLADVAADEDAPQPFRDVARLREIALRFDALPPEQVVARLKPLAVPGNAWFGSAGELLGAAYLKQGRADLAGPLFAAIAKDKTVLASLRARAQQVAGLLGVDAVVDVDQAAGSSPGAASTEP